MAIMNMAFNTGRLKSLFLNNPGRSVIADRFVELARQLASGMLDPLTLTFDDTPLAAAGTATCASCSGTVVITINGVAFSLTASGSDTVQAAAFVTAINASGNALISGLVTASSALGVVTITASRLGVAGNAMTLAVSGTGMTASGARLTAGSNGTTTAMTF